jgi:hypothetical protein
MASGDQIAVNHYDAGDIDGQISITELIEMKNVWLQFAHERGEERGGFRQIFFRFLHPFQMEGRGAIIEAVQMIHPGGLVRKRNLAETNQRDSHTASDESGHKLARVGPRPRKRIGSDENVHGTSPAKFGRPPGTGDSADHIAPVQAGLF